MDIISIPDSNLSVDQVRNGSRWSIEKTKVMKLIANKILITHNKSEVVWPLDIVNKSNQIVDLATNNDLHYFVMTLTKTRYKGRLNIFTHVYYFRR